VKIQPQWVVTPEKQTNKQTTTSSHPTSKHKPHLFTGNLLSGENGNTMGATDDLRLTAA
jgi:hypothetical protein